MRSIFETNIPKDVTLVNRGQTDEEGTKSLYGSLLLMNQAYEGQPSSQKKDIFQKLKGKHYTNSDFFLSKFVT